MRNIAVIVPVLVFFFFSSCIQESGDRYYNPSFLNDSDSYYQEYPEETQQSDEDIAEYKWDVRFSFYGIINNGDAPMESLQMGSGSLIYLNDIGESITVNGRVYALRKNMTITSGHEVPLIQIFFGDDTPGEDGWVLFYVLQLEGSSVSKAETYYLNNDKIYRARMLWQDNEIKEVCYDQEPYTHKGKVIIYTGNIRIGEDLRVEGNAMMRDMETIECRVLE